MISTYHVLRRFAEVGRDAVMCKVDYADAYKNQPVAPADLHLNAVKVGGRVLVETSLTFGE